MFSTVDRNILLNIINVEAIDFPDLPHEFFIFAKIANGQYGFCQFYDLSGVKLTRRQQEFITYNQYKNWPNILLGNNEKEFCDRYNLTYNTIIKRVERFKKRTMVEEREEANKRDNKETMMGNMNK